MWDLKYTEPAEGVFPDYILATAALLGLALEPEWRGAIAENVKLLASAAAAIDAVMPADGVESAVAFGA